MYRNLNIRSSVIIRNNSVIKDSALLYSHEGVCTELLEKIYKNLEISYPKFHKMDTLCKLGFLSAEIMFKDIVDNRGEETGLIISNSSSSLDTDRKHQSTINNKSDFYPSPSVFVYTLPNVVIGEICIRHKIQGEGCFFITRSFDPELLFRQTEQLFATGIRRCLTGWIEAYQGACESALFLVEECNETESGIANFSPDSLKEIYTA